MQAKFAEGIGGKLAKQWVATLLTPAFAFWAGGLAAWTSQHGWVALKTQLILLLQSLQIALFIGALLVVSASAFIIQRFDLPALRYLEGYWSQWFPLRWLLLHRQKRK